MTYILRKFHCDNRILDAVAMPARFLVMHLQVFLHSMNNGNHSKFAIAWLKIGAGFATSLTDTNIDICYYECYDALHVITTMK